MSASNWCMKEFREAYAYSTGNKKSKFLIPLIYGDAKLDDLNADMKFYLKNHTYLECRNMVCVKLHLFS